MEVLSGMVFGWRAIDAAASFDAVPVNASAVFYRKVAFCFFLMAAFLLLAAALVDTLAGARAASEAIGWSAIACAQVCVFSGLRYRAVNTRPVDDDAA